MTPQDTVGYPFSQPHMSDEKLFHKENADGKEHVHLGTLLVSI